MSGLELPFGNGIEGRRIEHVNHSFSFGESKTRARRVDECEF